jgi:hypothetical protein
LGFLKKLKRLTGETNVTEIWDVEQLRAEIKIKDITYNMLETKATLTYNLTVRYGKKAATALYEDVVQATPQSINSIYTLMNQYTQKITYAMKGIRESINMLLQLSKAYVSIDLYEILEQLSKKIDMKGKRVR